MNKFFSFLTLMVSILIILSGCSNVNLAEVSDEDLERISDKAVVCNEPYIRFGTSCCLDNNNNSICDEDESLINESEESNEEVLSEIEFEEDNSLKDEVLEEEEIIEEVEEEVIEEKPVSNFDELILELEEKDDSLLFEWNQYDLESNFKWYSISSSITHPDEEEVVISSSALLRDISEDEYLFTTTLEEDTTYYFWIDIILEDDSEIRSNIIEYYVEKEVEEEEEFQRCKYLALTDDDHVLYTMGARYEINSKEKCVEQFEETIEENEHFACSDVIRKRQLIYKESEEDEFEVIQEELCPIEEFDELKTISIGEDEIQTISIGGVEYELSVEDIFASGLKKIRIDDDYKEFPKIFDKNSIGDLYVLNIDNVVSTRESVTSWTQLVIANYDFTLTSSDVERSCYEKPSEDGAKDIIFSTISDETFEVKESYCMSDSVLVQYTCDYRDDLEEEIEVTCPHGCDNGRCLSIVEAGCDKEGLNSGILELGEEETITISNSTVLEITSVETGIVEVTIDGEDTFLEMCEEETINGIKYLVHDMFVSEREGVKGVIQISYE